MIFIVKGYLFTHMTEKVKFMHIHTLRLSLISGSLELKKKTEKMHFPNCHSGSKVVLYVQYLYVVYHVKILRKLTTI